MQKYSKFRSEALSFLRKEYKIKINLRAMKNREGFALINDNKIIVKNDIKSDDYFLSTLFHEIGHIHCYRNRIYPAYHHVSCLSSLTKKQKIAAVLTGFRAEKFVDKWASIEMKKHFPKRKFIFSYVGVLDKDWLHKNHLNIYYKDKK